MSEYYDIVVVGGGIHGVGVAQAAACHGYSALVLEQHALASGSSSRSSKLIHGGLRYLEGYDFALVRESLAERDILLRIAPELVRLQPFFIPVYPDTSRRPWLLRAGLSLYALLDGFGQGSRFNTLPRQTWGSLDGLDTRRLQVVFRYHDAQTNDADLTRAVMQSAIEHGAELACPAEFTGARVLPDGCEVEYRVDGVQKHCNAGVLVNAAGPWVDRVDALVSPQPAPVAIDLVQGTHLVMQEPVQAGCYYVEAPQDRRAIFLLPWGEHALLGTTERTYRGDPRAVQATDTEEAYLLEVQQHYFPQRSTEVVGRFAGLRVLPAAQGATFGRTRETHLEIDNPDQPRRLSIYGGKLTGYRATAEKIMKQLRHTLPERKPVADTAEVTLAPVD
ncbi:MAG: FAD-dependent oxidoreductase [Gammaproteobacteria bacterium]|nr:FAD-dependent oxidoreductase [Gammaproteobacteria bacterium]